MEFFLGMCLGFVLFPVIAMGAFTIWAVLTGPP